MSSLSRKLVFYRVLFAWAFLAFAALPLSTANADKAQTGGFSVGGGAGAGYGGTVAVPILFLLDQRARRRSPKLDPSGSKIVVVQAIWSSNKVSPDQSVCRAASTKKKIEALPGIVLSSANSVESAGTADTAAAAVAEAYASFEKKVGATAYASSLNGAYAYANTSAAVPTVAYVPDGTTQTITKGKLTASISYTALGSFSIAWTKGKKAGAVSGTTENTAALAAGNIKAAIKSATYAAAELRRKCLRLRKRDVNPCIQLGRIARPRVTRRPTPV